MRPERSNLRPQKLDLRPKRPNSRSERPDLRPKGPDLRPKRPDGGGDKQIKEQINGRTKVPLCSMGLLPLLSRCPKNVKKFIF